MDEAIRIATVLTPLLSARPLPKEAVDGFLLSLPLFSDVTREEIAFFFDLFASKDFHGSCLLPEKAEEDCLSLFLKREVELFRLIALFDDIQSGMLEYGLDAYRIENDLEDGFDILSTIEGKEEKGLMEELKSFVKRDDMDEKDAKRLKKDLRDILPLVGKEIAKILTRNIILYQIDDHWKAHLRDMDDLKQSVQTASYEQKDPVVIYKLEGYNLFAAMLESLNRDVLSFLLKAFVPLVERKEAPQPARAPRPATDMSQMRTSRSDLVTNGERKANAPVKAERRVGRNDPCPCGSGKKYKNCHGRFEQ